MPLTVDPESIAAAGPADPLRHVASAGRSLLAVLAGSSSMQKFAAAGSDVSTVEEAVTPSTSSTGPSPNGEVSVCSSAVGGKLIDDANNDEEGETSPSSWWLLGAAFRRRGSGSNTCPIPQKLALPGERAFDIADSLEGGMARESTTDFTTPLRRSGRLWRFRVLRSEDRMQARLVTENGEFLMYARVYLELHTVSFYLYDPARKEDQLLFNRAAPAFTMTFNDAHDEWRLVQERCENCEMVPEHLSCSRHGKQQLALIRHGKSHVGGGISNIMEAYIPGIYSNGRALLWCPMLGRGELGMTEVETHDTQVLVTKLPTWNPQVQSLVLDFHGRNIVSSAKNFQLALQQKPEHVLCQYGKLSNTNFSLDFKFPLGVAQAFAMAMSTMFWV